MRAPRRAELGRRFKARAAGGNGQSDTGWELGNPTKHNG